MATVKMPYIEPGLAAFEVLDSYQNTTPLVSGHHPQVATMPLTVAANQVLRQFEVVGFNGDGALVPATDAIDAIGVVTQAVTGNAGGTTTVPTIYSGCLNPDALVWHASLDTEAERLAAFKGAPSPTQIVLRKRQH